ncbi:MAG: cytochrome c peroxidase [Nevskia sp.]|nr:cytochrome c peroxidase [Nevskia sp.]
MSRRVQRVLAAGICVLGGVAAPTFAQSTLSLQAQVGKKLFFDTNLSASQKMSCATCHDPGNHYAQSNTLSVQLGGPTLTTPGFRAVPTLTYKEYTPPYNDNAANPDGVSTNSPGGGFTWSGRADTLAQQAAIPLLSSFEMANTNAAAVVQVVQNASYAGLFQQAYSADVFSNTQTAFTDIGLALQQYQLEDSSFHPFNSKFDYYAQQELSNGQVVTLTASELAGFNVFTDAKRGNCFACHYSGPMTGGGQYMFTDFTYEAIGVPRNPNIPANATRIGLPAYYDLGLCTAVNPDPQNAYVIPHMLPGSASLCGMFKVPTLRNTATRKVFFHNGIFNSLAQVLSWYNTRDTNPAAWYPTVKGVVQKFNDMPAAYQANIDPQVPLDGLPVGGAPHMTAQDLQNLQCFLETLTDGYVAGVTPEDPNCAH